MGGIALFFASCLDPTEIEVFVSTDLACDVVTQHGVAIAIGKAGDDMNGSAGTTHDCSSDGGIGSLTVTPHDIDGVVGIRVMLGIDASVDDCNAQNKFAGCLVARRSLGFIPHRPLILPIELQEACIGQVCDPSSTCFNGACVDAGVTCEGTTCELPDSGPPPPPPPPPACVPFGPVPVVTSGALPYSPHVVRFPSGGWLVTWVGGALTNQSMYVQYVDPSGVAQGPRVIALLGNAQGVTGPLGTDGNTVCTFWFDSSSSPLTLIGSDLDGGSHTLGQGGAAPLDGVLSLGQGFYDSLFVVGPGNPEIFTVDANLGAIGAGSVPNLDLTSTAGLGLARAGSSTFISYAKTTDNTCHVARCVQGTCGDVFSYGGCPVVRTAVASATSWASVGTLNGAPRLRVQNGTTSDVPIAATLATPPAGIPLVTSNDAYAFIRDKNDVLARVDVANLTPIALATNLGYNAASGLGAGFDVVADDPIASRAYAYVYWSMSTVMLTHVCP